MHPTPWFDKSYACHRRRIRCNDAVNRADFHWSWCLKLQVRQNFCSTTVSFSRLTVILVGTIPTESSAVCQTESQTNFCLKRQGLANRRLSLRSMNGIAIQSSGLHIACREASRSLKTLRMTAFSES